MHKKTAQSIAENASEIIGYGVLVTDEKGVIIGCSDIRRVGMPVPPRITAHFERMLARPAVQRTLAAEGLSA